MTTKLQRADIHQGVEKALKILSDGRPRTTADMAYALERPRRSVGAMLAILSKDGRVRNSGRAPDTIWERGQ